MALFRTAIRGTAPTSYIWLVDETQYKSISVFSILYNITGLILTSTKSSVSKYLTSNSKVKIAALASEDLLSYHEAFPTQVVIIQSHMLSCKMLSELKIICVCLGGVSFVILAYMAFVLKLSYLPITFPQYLLALLQLLTLIKMSLYASLLYMCPWKEDMAERWVKSVTMVLGSAFNCFVIMLFFMMACVYVI